MRVVEGSYGHLMMRSHLIERSYIIFAGTRSSMDLRGGWTLTIGKVDLTNLSTNHDEDGGILSAFGGDAAMEVGEPRLYEMVL